MTTATPPSAKSRFRTAYAEHRAAEGRHADGATLAVLPYLERGPFAREWAVRARTYRAFFRRVIGRVSQSLNVLDLGAGPGWLSYRLTGEGHRAIALDWRWDSVDGLGAGAPYAVQLPHMFGRVGASFDALPFASRSFDVVVFNAAIHYAEDLVRVLAEAARVSRPGGQIAILDSPFYRRAADGERMVAEKRQDAVRVFGDRAAALLALKSIEYLTPDSLATASVSLGLAWRRRRVWYPLWYELRPLAALIQGRRRPSRFDLWTTAVP